MIQGAVRTLFLILIFMTTTTPSTTPLKSRKSSAETKKALREGITTLQHSQPLSYHHHLAQGSLALLAHTRPVRIGSIMTRNDAPSARFRKEPRRSRLALELVQVQAFSRTYSLQHSSVRLHFLQEVFMGAQHPRRQHRHHPRYRLPI